MPSLADMSSLPIVAFYRGEAQDHAGRRLEEILAWSDSMLEGTHDYIQWLFPLTEPSPVNPLAPVVDEATQAAFAADPALRAALSRAFDRMARFYGLAVHRKGKRIRIERAVDWPQRSRIWLTVRNHNMLRITRIIRSLRLLGLESTAEAFFDMLSELYDSPEGDPIGSMTFDYWQDAARA